MRRTRYDVAIDMQGLLKSAVIARLSGARRVIGFNARYAREPLARLFYTDVHDPGGEGIYAAVRNASRGRHQPWAADAARHCIACCTGVPDRRSARRRQWSAVDCPSAGRPFALLNTGAAWPNKRWPPARLAELARRCATRHSMRSIVLWGPGERELADAGRGRRGRCRDPVAADDHRRCRRRWPRRAR